MISVGETENQHISGIPGAVARINVDLLKERGRFENKLQHMRTVVASNLEPEARQQKAKLDQEILEAQKTLEKNKLETRNKLNGIFKE